MSCSRRVFLKDVMSGTLASVLPLSAFTFLTTEEAKAAVEESKVRWAFLVDAIKCVGCGLCVEACKTENEIPYDSPVTRTWVERYIVTKDGQTHIDSPAGGIEGFTDNEVRGEEIDPDNISKAFFVPKKEIKDNAYDLSINRYKEIEYEEVQYDPPAVIIGRLEALQAEIAGDLKALRGML